MSGPRLRGVVVAFDPDVGLGEVRSADGSSFAFHCTQVADGSRTIAVGTEVIFEVLAGRGGRWEAGGLEPLSQQPPERDAGRGGQLRSAPPGV